MNNYCPNYYIYHSFKGINFVITLLDILYANFNKGLSYMSVSAEDKEFTQSFAVTPSIRSSIRVMTTNIDSLFSIDTLDDVICLENE